MNAVPGARGLFYVEALALAWHLGTTLFFALFPGLTTGLHEQWSRISAAMWLVLGIAELAVMVPFAQGRRGSAAERPARALVILTALALVSSLLHALPQLGGPQVIPPDLDLGRLLFAGERLLFVATAILLWVSLARSLATPSRLGPAYYVLVAIGAAMSSLYLVLPTDQFLGAIRSPLWSWGRPIVSFTRQLLVLSLLWALLRGGVPSVESAASSPAPVAGRDIAMGAVWLGGGLLVTLLSYSAAASSSGGGRYVVTTGAIVYGLVRLVRGLMSPRETAEPARTPDE